MKKDTLVRWVKFEKINEYRYRAIDLQNQETHILDAETVRFARHLDGHADPYKVDSRWTRRQVAEMLLHLDELELLRNRRVYTSLIGIYLTLWQPKVTPKMRLVSYLINLALLISWFPFLCISFFFATDYICSVDMDYFIHGIVLGTVVGMVMHELGHMFACLGYGGRVFELGVGVHCFMPVAYVMNDDSPIKNKLHRAQVSAAGVEMNMFVAGVFFMLSAIPDVLGSMCFSAAICNIVMGIFNMAIVTCLDGAHVFSQLTGIDLLNEKIKRVVRHRLYRKRLLNKGASGVATIAVCYTIRTMQLVGLPLFIFSNILGVVAWFV